MIKAIKPGEGLCTMKTYTKIESFVKSLSSTEFEDLCKIVNEEKALRSDTPYTFEDKMANDIVLTAHEKILAVTNKAMAILEVRSRTLFNLKISQIAVNNWLNQPSCVDK
jgi:hypothetical protein